MSRELKRFFDKKARTPQVVGLFQRYGIEGSVNGSSLVKAVNQNGDEFIEDLVTVSGYPEAGRQRIVEFIRSAAHALGDYTIAPLRTDQAEQPKETALHPENFDGFSIQMGAREKQTGPDEKFMGMPKATGQLVTVLVILIVIFVLLKTLR